MWRDEAGKRESKEATRCGMGLSMGMGMGMGMDKVEVWVVGTAGVTFSKVNILAVDGKGFEGLDTSWG